MQEKSDGRTLILKCDNRGGSTPRRDMASRERGLQFGQQAAHMGRISTGSRSTGSLLTPTPVMVKYALRAQLLARKFGAKASERGTLSFRQRKLWWRTAREMNKYFSTVYRTAANKVSFSKSRNFCRVATYSPGR